MTTSKFDQRQTFDQRHNHCVRETEILVEQQPPRGVFVYDHAGRVTNKLCRLARRCEETFELMQYSYNDRESKPILIDSDAHIQSVPPPERERACVCVCVCVCVFVCLCVCVLCV